jgi:hypothetical protein
MVVAFLRGDALYTAAEATFRVFYLPWQLHRVIQNPQQAKRSEVINLACKHTAMELTCVLCRYVVTAVGVSFSLYLLICCAQCIFFQSRGLLFRKHRVCSLDMFIRWSMFSI